MRRHIYAQLAAWCFLCAALLSTLSVAKPLPHKGYVDTSTVSAFERRCGSCTFEVVGQNNALTRNGTCDKDRSCINLDLSAFGIRSLPARVFQGLRSVRRLKLDRNFVTALPMGLFDDLSELILLTLDNNGISRLTQSTLDGPGSSLEVLTISQPVCCEGPLPCALASKTKVKNGLNDRTPMSIGACDPDLHTEASASARALLAASNVVDSYVLGTTRPSASQLPNAQIIDSAESGSSERSGLQGVNSASEEGRGPSYMNEKAQDLPAVELEGFLGQQLRLVGPPGKAYALISDTLFELNARLAPAYQVAQGAASPHIRDRLVRVGTWIDQVGLMLWDGSSLEIKTRNSAHMPTKSEPAIREDASPDLVEPKAFTYEVILNGKALALSDGQGGVEDYVMGRLGVTTVVAVWPEQHSARVFIAGDVISMSVEVVSPPREWDVEDVAPYTHLDINIDEVYLSPVGHGVLGNTQNIGPEASESQPRQGEAIVESLSPDGTESVSSLEAYEVSSLLSSDFKYSVFYSPH